MALIDRRRDPTLQDLRVFGLLLVTFSGLLGGLGLYHTGSWTIPAVIWTAGVVISGVYYGVPATQTIIFQVWMSAVFPIGWIISHGLLVIVYYGVITPIGFALRLLSRDPLHQQRQPFASTYWVACSSTKDVKRYFQQF
jgi:hypothetical protein